VPIQALYWLAITIGAASPHAEIEHDKFAQINLQRTAIFPIAQINLRNNVAYMNYRIRLYKTFYSGFVLLLLQSVALANAFAAEDDVLLMATSKTVIENWIQTGVIANDSRSYWNCKVNSDPQVDNLHVRFWKDGSGHSGHHQFQWTANSATSINISIKSRQMNLTEFSFELNDGNPNAFHAIDADGSVINCEWSGPPRNNVLDYAQFDQGESLLAQQLKLNNPDYWLCSDTKSDGTMTQKNWRFNTNGIGMENDQTAFLWTIDSHYNVILSYENSVSVLRDISFQSLVSQDDQFTAYRLGDSISCLKNSG